MGQSGLEFTERDFDRLFANNTKGAFFTLQKAANYVVDNYPVVPYMLAAKSPPVPGRSLGEGNRPLSGRRDFYPPVSNSGCGVDSAGVNSDFSGAYQVLSSDAKYGNLR